MAWLPQLAKKHPPTRRRPGSSHSKKLILPPPEHQRESIPNSPESTVFSHFEKARSLPPFSRIHYQGTTSQLAEDLSSVLGPDLTACGKKSNSDAEAARFTQQQQESVPDSPESAVFSHFEKAQSRLCPWPLSATQTVEQVPPSAAPARIIGQTHGMLAVGTFSASCSAVKISDKWA
jgi:hypothetical protein